jgi:hypothetical protein
MSADLGSTVDGNSLERINQYLNNDQEPKPTEGGIPPAYWPSSGNLRVEKLSARYSEVWRVTSDGIQYVDVCSLGWTQGASRRVVRNQER